MKCRDLSLVRFLNNQNRLPLPGYRELPYPSYENSTFQPRPGIQNKATMAINHVTIATRKKGISENQKISN